MTGALTGAEISQNYAAENGGGGSTLLPSQSITVTATTTLNETTTNVATVEGLDPQDDPVTDSDSVTVAVTVATGNQAPELDAIGDQYLIEGDTLSVPLSATDPDSGDTLTFSASNTPAFATLMSQYTSSQTQTFVYDSVYRLTQAYTSGGIEGSYNESYTYDATTGNLSSKAGVSYGYQDTNHFHAVTHLDSVQKYWYDANGNMTDRIVGSDSYDLTYDAEQPAGGSGEEPDHGWRVCV